VSEQADKPRRAPKGRPPERWVLTFACPIDPDEYRASAARLRAYVGEIADRLARGEPLDPEQHRSAIKVLRGFAASPIQGLKRPALRPPKFDPTMVALEIAMAVASGVVNKTGAIAAAANRYGVSERRIAAAIGKVYAIARALVEASSTHDEVVKPR